MRGSVSLIDTVAPPDSLSFWSLMVFKKSMWRQVYVSFNNHCGYMKSE